MSVGISTTNYAEVVEICISWAAERKNSPAAAGHYICVTSVHGIILAKEDPDIARFINAADIVTPDGMPVVWALRSFGYHNQQRVYGPTLMLQICKRAAEMGHRIFLYGARQETLSLLKNRLTERLPSLKIAGCYSPPFRELTPEEDRAVEAQIRESDADIVFVGVSTPKQERWMYEHRSSFPGITLIGVGAAFDFHAGRIRQAPAWMQRNGLEWLFRLLSEPARLWRRYLVTTPKFLPLWARQKWLQSDRNEP
ncbi:MAG TPA: WecB/TagA/CpsF family glycosyltransferase [Bryobacteraceae bacterium]|nr:WecB/TagA/CpsF family glycosyltransferase [Bryobacteraceae bacterium]